ncbi:MAG: hypothetical protein LBB93_01640 [Elusimicrobiota bacterium]|jgi:hypothetical protein|nr:hypothetical protein [Elusimicrobiota bacterium]
MLKVIRFCSILFSLLAISAIPTYAAQISIIDSPTTQIIEYGSFNVDFKVFREGGLTPKLEFGVFSFLNLGVAWEVQKLIGDSQADLAMPTLQVKVQIYSGDMSLPGIAIGYDGQGYIHMENEPDKYYQEPRGVYILIGREVFTEGLIMNVGVNSNTLKDGEIYGFINMSLPVGSENFLFLAEYDNINYMPDSRLNLGVRIVLSPDVRVDLIVRDCWGANEEGLFPNDRMLKLSYTGQF